VNKVLLYAPGNDEGKQIMENILDELQIRDLWHLEPVQTTDASLTSSYLTEVLTNGLRMARTKYQDMSAPAPVVFMGMDCPHLPLDEIVTALSPSSSSSVAASASMSSPSLVSYPSPCAATDHPSASTRSGMDVVAHICPAADGGWVMLSVPPEIPTDVPFANVKWSHSLTALSQIKALTDVVLLNEQAKDGIFVSGCVVRVGRVMSDIDEPEDVLGLVSRLNSFQQNTKGLNDATALSTMENFYPSSSFDLLTQPSKVASLHPIVSSMGSHTGFCRYSRKVLLEMGFLTASN
jgi:glycosyltransferase A (GT-A) superfamily protein (DUF2064 family)